MKTEANRRKRSAGITMLEALFVGACVAGLVVFVMLPSMAQTKCYAPRIKCVSNLKQIGLGFRIFANDNKGLYPFFVEGLRELHTGTVIAGNTTTARTWMHFQTLSNEFTAAKIIMCPTDRSRLNSEALDFLGGPDSLSHQSKRDQAVSYFVGLYADEAKPESILSGDRHVALSKGGSWISTHDAGRAIKVPDLAWWAPSENEGLHAEGGNVGLADGSVHQVESEGLQDRLENARSSYRAEYTNLFLFPQ